MVVGITHAMNTTLMPFIESVILKSTTPVHTTTWWASIFYGGINSIKILSAAAAIKVGKWWWFRQKEKERLEKEKIDADLQLLKAQIHPGFLFNTLNNIYHSALLASPNAPEMLLKLSDILSYMLYECNEREVFLEKELKMLQDYMVLEKTKFGDKLEMSILVKGCNSNEKIAPLLLLHFIENSFKQCSNILTEQPWINLELQIENHVLDMKLLNGKSSENFSANGEENKLEQAQRRLELLYPDKHELEISEEPEIMIVNLRVRLQELEQNAGIL
jgi:Putative regulator of cell autolysis